MTEQLSREEDRDIGLVGRMVRVFYAPGETFEAVGQRTTWLDWFVPTLLVVLFTLVTIQLTMPLILQAQSEVLQEQLKTLPEAQRQQMLAQMQGVTSISSISTVVVTPISVFVMLFISGGVLLLIARYVLEGKVQYGQMLAVWGYASLVGIIGVLVRTPLMLAKDTAAVYTGLGVFVPDEMAKTFLGRLLAGMDLFSFWQFCLIGIGLATLTGVSTRRGLVPVLLLWALWILVQASLGGLGKGG